MFRFSRLLLLRGSILVYEMLFISLAAASERAGCPVEPLAPIELKSPISEPDPQADDVLHISADRIESLNNNKVTLSGGVIIIRGDQRLVADKVIYDKAMKTLDATGNVRLEQLGGRFLSSNTFINLESNTGFSEIGDFTLRQGLGRGHAERIVFVAKGRIKLKVARFTTCAANKEDWYLNAGEIELDSNTAVGTARNTSLRFKGVPVFYSPYMTFPLGEQRRSGFLLPEFGTTDNVGSYLTVPYYWDIAPNYDATLKPRYMSRRGIQLQSEFRYLGSEYQGKTELEVLPNDAVTGNARLGATYRHQHRFGQFWSASADIDWVGDNDYFNDFSTQLSSTSQTHLPQTIAARYQRNNWNVSMSASNYQTVDKSVATIDYPYARLPQLTADWRPSPRTGRLNYELYATTTEFRHDTKESARRLHLQPSMSFPIEKEYGYLIPRLSLYSSTYANRSVGADASVSVPVSSIDSGLVFERRLGSRPDANIHTLEPRLFIVHAPYAFQDNLPLFDTSMPTFTFNSLFQENRFIGSDRVGDAQQMTLALTSRLLDGATGSQRFNASIGQTFYFSDRRVNLAGSSVTESRSDIAAELSAWLGRNWYARSSVQWRPQSGNLEKNNQFLQYHPNKKSIVNLGYRFENATQELLDISTEWPIAKKWTLLARSQYSLKDQQNQDSYAGLMYDTCCWSLRTMATRRIDQNSAQVSGIAFQIIFKGLAGFESGVASETPLEQSVFD